MTPDRARELLDAEEARLRAMIEPERRRLSESLEEETGELTAFDQHPADVGTETHDRELDQSMLQANESGLEAVAAARRRLEEGSYGRCETCGRAIPDERLEAQPATRFCVQHQSERERDLGVTGP